VFKGSGDGKTRKWLSWEARLVWIKAETYLAAPKDTVIETPRCSTSWQLVGRFRPMATKITERVKLIFTSLTDRTLETRI
jgi:hypothetical protein